MALTPDMIDLLGAGVGHQVGGCTNAGRPSVCRGLAAQLEPDGRLVVMLSAQSGFEVLRRGARKRPDRAQRDAARELTSR